MHKLKEDDFVLKKYSWVDISLYALTEDNFLLRYHEGKTGFPFYQCLYQGWWEPTDACGIGYSTIASAKSIPEEEAKKIISNEEKPRSTRPLERNSWLNC